MVIPNTRGGGDHLKRAKNVVRGDRGGEREKKRLSRNDRVHPE